MGKETDQEPTKQTAIQSYQTIYIRGFDSTGNLTKELTAEELDFFVNRIYTDSSVVQIQYDFDHPDKDLAQIVGKLSEETKRLLLKTIRFGPGP